MGTFLATLLFFLLAMLGLAIGYLLTGKRLKGSCGGLPAAMAKYGADADIPEFCPVCQRPTAELDGTCGKEQSDASSRGRP